MARTYLVRTIRPGFTRRGFAHCGFTLIEVVMALFIVSLAVAGAVPAYRSLGEVDDLTQATRRVETLFRLARDSAIRSGLPVTVVIDSIDGLVWIDTVEPLGLSSPEVRDALAYPDYAPEPGMLSALVGDQNDDELLGPARPSDFQGRCTWSSRAPGHASPSSPPAPRWPIPCSSRGRSPRVWSAWIRGPAT